VEQVRQVARLMPEELSEITVFWELLFRLQITWEQSPQQVVSVVLAESEVLVEQVVVLQEQLVVRVVRVVLQVRVDSPLAVVSQGFLQLV